MAAQEEGGAGPTINRVGWRRLVAAPTTVLCTIFNYNYRPEVGFFFHPFLYAVPHILTLLTIGFVHIDVKFSFLRILKERFLLSVFEYPASQDHISHDFLESFIL